jgi:hypothetical protein
LAHTEYAEALAQDRLKDLAQSQVVVAGEQQAEDVVFAGEQLRAPEEVLTHFLFKSQFPVIY